MGDGSGVGANVGEWVDTETESTAASAMLKARPPRRAGLSRRRLPDSDTIAAVSVPSVTAACKVPRVYEKSVAASSTTAERSLRVIDASKVAVTPPLLRVAHSASKKSASGMTVSMAASRTSASKSSHVIPLSPMSTWTRGERVGVKVGSRDGFWDIVGGHVSGVGTGDTVGTGVAGVGHVGKS